MSPAPGSVALGAPPMNLNTVEEVRGAGAVPRGDAAWQPGDAWLAGGTWLFSEPQPAVRRLFDLRDFGWTPLVAGGDGLRIAATCTIAELERFAAPPDWTAAPLIGECCRAFLASFKIWNEATVGGNVCMSLPASPMVSLAASLDATLSLRALDGSERRVAALDFVTGNHQNVLAPGELLTSILLPAAALRQRFAFRRVALTHLGRSTALLVGTTPREGGPFALTVSAATPRPVRVGFPALPDQAALRRRLGDAIPEDGWFDDVHGSPDYRRHMTHYLAEQIRAELGRTG
jgi:CO/xanthine dehydrogenase FAD-binding subunit